MKLIANILGIVAIIIFIFSYQQKNKKKLLVTQTLASCCFILQYGFLQTISAAGVEIVTIIKNTVFIKYENKEQKAPIIFVYLFITISAIITYFTYENIFSLIPLTAQIIHIFGNWQRKVSIICLCGIIISILWMIYNATVGAYASILGALIQVISSVIGYRKAIKQETKIE